MELGDEIIYASPDSALIFFKKAYLLANKIKNDTLIYKTTKDMGNVYESKGAPDSAISFYTKYYELVKNNKQYFNKGSLFYIFTE